MIFGYIRVSSNKQTVENQKFEITRFCKAHDMTVDGWISESISGTCSYNKRKLGRLLRRVKKGDIIICSEISRLGRSLYMIMEILNICMSKDCKVWTVKDGFRLGDDIQSKVLAFAFGLSAEIERQLISQRTKDALERKRNEGMVLGRPKGSKTSLSKHKLFPYMSEIHLLYNKGMSIWKLSKTFGVSYNTMKRFILLLKVEQVSL